MRRDRRGPLLPWHWALPGGEHLHLPPPPQSTSSLPCPEPCRRTAHTPSQPPSPRSSSTTHGVLATSYRDSSPTCMHVAQEQQTTVSRPCAPGAVTGIGPGGPGLTPITQLLLCLIHHCTTGGAAVSATGSSMGSTGAGADHAMPNACRHTRLGALASPPDQGIHLHEHGEGLADATRSSQHRDLRLQGCSTRVESSGKGGQQRQGRNNW